MKKPAYCEAAVNWDDEDFQADVKAFGVPNCEAIHRSLLCGGSISHLQPPVDIFQAGEGSAPQASQCENGSNF